MQSRDLAGGERRAGRGKRLVADQGTRLCQQTVDGSARNDSVVVVRESLHFHQSLPASGRASLEVRSLLWLAVITFHHRLPDRCHEVDRAIAEVRDTLRIGGPRCVPRIGRGVTAVSLCGRIALRQIRRGRIQARAGSIDRQVTGPPTAPESDQLAVPGLRQTIHDGDVGVRRGCNDSGHFAECRCFGLCVGSDHSRRSDRRIFENRHTGQRSA